MSTDNSASAFHVERPCESTPEGALFPGRPGEALAEFIARREREWASGPEIIPNLTPAWQRFGYWEMGR